MHASLLSAAAAIALLAGITHGHASLVGQGFGVSYRYDSLGTQYGGATAAPASFTVGAGVESVINVENVTDLIVDAAAFSLTILFDTALLNPTWNAASFNGLLFTGTAAHGVASATVDPASTLAGFDASRILLTGDEIGLNWNGLGYEDGTSLVINFAFTAVPEPAALALFGAGLASLAAARRRRLDLAG